LYDILCLSEPIGDLYGPYRQGLRFCSWRT